MTSSPLRGLGEARHTQGLNARERQILRFIAQHTPCTVREIGLGVGLRSSATVHGHLKWLDKRGLIRREPDRSRTIRLYEDVVVSEKGLIGWWARYPDEGEGDEMNTAEREP